LVFAISVEAEVLKLLIDLRFDSREVDCIFSDDPSPILVHELNAALSLIYLPV
jgi:hypothetical protein